MISIETLNGYSRTVYDFIKSNYPNYLEYISTETCANFGGSYLKLEIESPNKKSAYNLTFDSDNNQLTICFDSFHCHFDNFSELDFNEEMKKSIDTIEKIMSEQLITVSYYSNENLVLSGIEKPNFIDCLEEESPFLLSRNIDKITTNSWTGVFDKVKELK